jgi:hypothetical protein
MRLPVRVGPTVLANGKPAGSADLDTSRVHGAGRGLPASGEIQGYPRPPAYLPRIVTENMRNRTDATGFFRVEREEAVIAGERAA